MMRRRDFLRATLVTAGSVAVPAACSDDDGGANACTLEPNGTFYPQSVASGDPRPESVVLWTRLVDPDATGDLTVSLKMARDEAFQDVVLLGGAGLVVVTAAARYDHCVKVKVTGLSPGTTYYYQFFYAKGDSCYTSPIGRTKTAPAPDEDTPVRFAFVSCQDYVGRYFNAYLALAKQEIDFFVHLGDYIYETTGDPGFQTTPGARDVTFTDEADAIALGTEEDEPFLAARSLSNYRDLYRAARSDRALQRMHELFPMIAVWDDHEFSDDCHGATACYFDGRQDERDVERRKAANQAWFEYMPVDYPAADDFQYDSAADFAADISIYRDFKFGKHLHLVMTDLRTYRTDHFIPEGAFPGEVIAEQGELAGVFGTVPTLAAPYFDIDTYKEGLYKRALEQAAEAVGFDPKAVRGLMSAGFINTLIARLNETTTPEIPLITAAELAAMDRGFSYAELGKSGFYSSIGARYLVVKDVFDPVSQIAFSDSTGAAADVMGADQQRWFLDTMKRSTSTWKVWGNEYTLSQLAIDLRGLGFLPEPFRRRFYLNCDSWDGFRERKGLLIEELAALDNVVVITGDIHAFFAGTPAVDDPSTGDDPTTEVAAKKVVEFVTSSISSKTLRSILVNQVENDPTLSQLSQARALADGIDAFLLDKGTKINPYLAFANSKENGFCVAEVSEAELVVTVHQFPESAQDGDASDDPEAFVAKGKQTRFKTISKTMSGSTDLYQEIEGAWKKWDPKELAWVD